MMPAVEGVRRSMPEADDFIGQGRRFSRRRAPATRRVAPVVPRSVDDLVLQVTAEAYDLERMIWLREYRERVRFDWREPEHWKYYNAYPAWMAIFLMEQLTTITSGEACERVGRAAHYATDARYHLMPRWVDPDAPERSSLRTGIDWHRRLWDAAFEVERRSGAFLLWS